MDKGGHLVRATVAVALAATLGLPWVHDEAGRSAGIRAVAPAAGTSTATAWWRAAVAAVVVLAVMTLARRRVRHLFAGRPRRPVPAGERRRTPPSRTARHATVMALAAAGLAALAGQAVRDLGPRAEPGPVVAAAAGAAAAVVWVRRAWQSRPETGTTLRGSAVAAAVVAAVVFATAGGVDWWDARPAESLDLSTGRPAAVAPAGPDDLGGVVWTAEADRVLPAGSDLVLVRYEAQDRSTGRTDVSVVDAATRRERWRLRRDGSLGVHVDVLAGVDGAPAVGTLVTAELVDGDLLDDEGLQEVVARDLAGGEVRWRRRIGRGAVTVVGDLVLVGGPAGVVAIDGTTGDPRWRRDLAGLGCVSGTGVDGVVLTRPSCGTSFVGVDLATGLDRWQRDLRETGAVGEPSDVVRLPAGAGVAVTAADEAGEVFTVVRLDPATGRDLWRRTGVGGVGATVAVEGYVAAVVEPTAAEAVVDQLDRAQQAVAGTPLDELPPPAPGAPVLQAFDVAGGGPGWSFDLAALGPADAAFSLGSDGVRAYVVTDGGSVAVVDAAGEVVDRLAVPVCDRPCDDGIVVDDDGGLDVVAGNGVVAVVTGSDTLGARQVTVLG